MNFTKSTTLPESTDACALKASFLLEAEAQTQHLAQVFAQLCEEQKAFDLGWMIYLKGDLGAGKSFFSRAFVQSFLPEQKVKSPTYALVENYQTDLGTIQHFDLYRLCDPEELEFLAIRDLLTPPFVALVEWPTKGEGVLPEADVLIELIVVGEARKARISACRERSNGFVKKLTEKVGMKFGYD
ncbi:tRNA (adenosine(37)-N6)-threonylcarbamoyltransferase complex ATPase subunit type 1 TsaE [Hydrogenovibrio sp. 3SP14C1]|uniref:tRNA (adenosine(37)-N6)-threonylcarbamoyltransferase complex ATPase subunit type 1 TsaE n=1 Tax=Hydrogenovibrio sp. 3SP14C1 TaxID=3038774 RepID=UPI00241642BE|nr:tRNA (adenosine(37)-N6)-threonylcarbamoyltransferase complex ATPase subunit type 1 TsaE [Hydrogenovibrio sp. 3SP14C1]MDG4812548.1 tRNA (adenosine(37)-N6)-threonylcarbamoyltransferase complex ATPase subunit type 1 TsaE [Hydrogenovibrio sp. 3SP14C1]